MTKIFYQHIPKTGGQTLATRIASAFPLGRSSIMGADLNFPDGIELLKKLFDEYDFVERHVNGPVLENFNELDILVTVREPVSQIVSNYLHILREPASPLHRPAKLLSPEAFFSQYGELMANHQTRYFISAYRGLHPDTERLVNWTVVLLDCLDRVRWFVPTESIDEFCMLWQIEMAQPMMLAETSINIAPTSSAQRIELERIVRGMPELYPIDLLFWQIAKQRYADYKRSVLNKAIATRYPDNIGRVWSMGEYGVWLGRGWYQPEMTRFGPACWAGPERLSEIRIKRNAELRYLVFSVIVFCGVYESNVKCVTREGLVIVPSYCRVDEQEVVYVFNLSEIDDECVIWLRVPEVWSAAMVSHTSDDTSRRSVATCKWMLSKNPPHETLATDLESTVENLKNLHAGDGHGK